MTEEKESGKVYSEAEMEILMLNKALESISKSLLELHGDHKKTRDAVHDIQNTLASWRSIEALMDTVKLPDRVKELESKLTLITDKITWWARNWFKVIIGASIIFGAIFFLGEVYPRFSDVDNPIVKLADIQGDK